MHDIKVDLLYLLLGLKNVVFILNDSKQKIVAEYFARLSLLREGFAG